MKILSIAAASSLYVRVDRRFAATIKADRILVTASYRRINRDRLGIPLGVRVE